MLRDQMIMPIGRPEVAGPGMGLRQAFQSAFQPTEDMNRRQVFHEQFPDMNRNQWFRNVFQGKGGGDVGGGLNRTWG